MSGPLAILVEDPLSALYSPNGGVAYPECLAYHRQAGRDPQM